MSHSVRRLWIYWFVFLGAVYLTCFHQLGSVGIFDLDEGLYATASRQMLESRDFIVPRIGNEVRFAKPPLIYWVQVPSLTLFGFTPFAIRFPSALCIAGTALLLWLHAARAGKSRAGWLAALVFLGSPLALVLARQGITDALLTFCLTLAIYGWCKAANAVEKDRSGWWLMAAAVGLAALAKGLLGMALPGAALILWLAVRPGKSAIRFRDVPWLPALGIALAIALPWHILMYRATGQEFLNEYFLSNQVKRFQGQQWGHVQPFWFYLPILAVGMFPWSALIPFSWWSAIRKPQENQKLKLEIWALWAAVIFVFFSISKSKLPGYMLPVMPPLAILIGARLDQLWNGRRALSYPEAACLCLIPLLLGGVGIVAGVLGYRWTGLDNAILFGKDVNRGAVDTVVLLAPWLFGMGIIFAVGAIALLISRRNARTVMGCLLAVNVTLYLVAIQGVLPVYAREQILPLHQLARMALPALDRGERVVIYALRPRRPSLRFVLGHTAHVTEIENAEPGKLREAVQHQAGYILAMRNAPLPGLPVRPTVYKVSGRWVLYRWSRN